MQRKIRSSKTKNYTSTAIGFTLTELLVCVGIIGLLSSIALPKYINSINATRQKDVANQISNIQTTIMAYREEFLKAPTTWDDLATITPISTYDDANNRSNAKGDLTSPINLDKYYKITVTKPKLNVIQITGSRIDTPSKWMIQSCLATETGVSDMEQSSGSLTTVSVSCE